MRSAPGLTCSCPGTPTAVRFACRAYRCCTRRHSAASTQGLQQAHSHLVYTTRGIGMVGPQIRTFCPPEVTVLTVRVREKSS